MRRTQFITAAVVAVITFFSLQAFVGHRYPGYGGDGYGRYWFRHHNDYGPGYDDRRGYWRNEPPAEKPKPHADSSSGRY